jgi:hypothetical protein
LFIAFRKNPMSFKNCWRLQPIEKGHILDILGNLSHPLGQDKMVNKTISQHLKRPGHEIDFKTFDKNVKI